MACTLDRTNPLGGLPPKRKFLVDRSDDDDALVVNKTNSMTNIPSEIFHPTVRIHLYLSRILCL